MFQERTKLVLVDGDGNIVTSTDRGDVIKSNKRDSPRHLDGYIAPNELILKWTSKLPPFDKDALSAAINEQFFVNNPFTENEATKAMHILDNPDKTHTVHFFIASKPQILAHYASTKNPAVSNYSDIGEVWISLSETFLINLPGFGESVRLKRASAQKKYTYAAFACLTLLACATALTPVLQTRMKAISASELLRDLAGKAAPAVKQRELFARSQQQIDTINTTLGGLIVPMSVLDSLSQAMPDTAHLVSLELSNESTSSDLATVKLSGKSQDTLELIKALSSTGVFTELKLATPVVRQPGTSQEFFSLTGSYKKQPLFEVSSINANDPDKEGKNEIPKN